MPKRSIYEEKIFSIILDQPGIRSKDLIKNKNTLGCCERTIFYNLKELIKKGMIEKGDNNRYYPTEIESIKKRVIHKKITELTSLNLPLTSDLIQIYYYLLSLNSIDEISLKIKSFLKILFFEKISNSEKAIKNFFMKNYNESNGTYANNSFELEFNIFHEELFLKRRNPNDYNYTKSNLNSSVKESFLELFITH
jgi:hypothetical protein